MHDIWSQNIISTKSPNSSPKNSDRIAIITTKIGSNNLQFLSRHGTDSCMISARACIEPRNTYNRKSKKYF